MKKAIIGTLLLVVVSLVGIMSINAASQTLYSDSSYTITSGFTQTQKALRANNDYFYASVDPSFVGVGSNYTIIHGKKATDLDIYGVQKQVALSTTMGYFGKIGNIGSGVWTLKNSAKNGATNLASWSGNLEYFSRS